MPATEKGNEQETVRAAEICNTTGITYRMLDYWVLRGYVPAPKVKGSGDAREYPASCIDLINCIMRYRNEGYELKFAVEKANHDRRRTRRANAS